ncbi:hypothetical protein Pint_20104 [Pistacia integerrima]|uniref:Uncharacterized protein n=1 Tax=Pistacia integerrima TaxID=434235 RepID=A0ACC0X9N2_9ROSI|nr:hypothetical protein Pint_20104 [Pistacia integerrima]
MVLDMQYWSLASSIFFKVWTS